MIRDTVLIAGSRDWPHKDRVRGLLIGIREDVLSQDWDVVYPLIISGGARGVDSWAIEAADQLDFQTQVYPADWETHGKAAGYIRNEEMVRVADRVVCFWDGQSKGTKHTIDLALKHKKHLEVLFP